MKKRMICTVLVLVLFALSACSKDTDALLTADGKEIGAGVYAYYLDKVLSDPDGYGVDAGDRQAALQKTNELCTRMIACENLMAKNDLTLSTQLKSEVADETEKIWSLFGSYYASVGVTKPDITLINTDSARKQQLLQYYYGKGGKDEVSDDALKEKFVDLYIGFKGFEGSFTKTNIKGETVAMTEKEKEELIAQFRKMAQEVDGGRAIDEVYSDYCAQNGLVATGALEIILMKDGDPMYSDDFFDKVSTITHGRAAPVTSGSSIYVVQRMTIATSDEDEFEKYRSQVLEEMKMPAVEKKISADAQKLDFQVDEKHAEKIFKTVSASHE